MAAASILTPKAFSIYGSVQWSLFNMAFILNWADEFNRLLPFVKGEKTGSCVKLNMKYSGVYFWLVLKALFYTVMDFGGNAVHKKKSRRCFSHTVYYFLQFMRTLSLCIKVTFHLCTYLFGLLKKVSWKHIKNMKGNVKLGVKGCVSWQDIYK